MQGKKAVTSLGMLAVASGLALNGQAPHQNRLDVPETMQGFLERAQSLPDDPTALTPLMKQVLHTPQLISDFRNVLSSGLKWAKHNPMTREGVPHEADVLGYKHMKKMQVDLEHLQEQGGTASLLERMQLALEDPTIKTRVPHELRKFYQDPDMRARMAEVMFQGVRQGQKVWAHAPTVQRNLALYGKRSAALDPSKTEMLKSAVVNFTLPKFHSILKAAEARSLLQLDGSSSVSKPPPADIREWDVSEIDTKDLSAGYVRQEFTNKLIGTGRAGCSYSDFFGLVLRIAIHTAYGDQGFNVFVSPLLHIHLMPMPPENPSMWKYGVGTMPFGTAFEFKFPDNYLGKGVGVDYVGAGVEFPSDAGDAKVSLEMMKAKGLAAVSTLIMLAGPPAAQGSRMLFTTGSGLKFGLPYAGSLEGWARWGFYEPTKGTRYLFDVAPNLNLWTPPFYIGRSRFVTKAVNFISFEFSQEGKFMNLLSSFLLDSAPHDHMIAGIETDEAMACWGYAKETPAPRPSLRKLTQEKKKEEGDEEEDEEEEEGGDKITKKYVDKDLRFPQSKEAKKLLIPQPPESHDFKKLDNVEKWLRSHGEGRMTEEDVADLYKLPVTNYKEQFELKTEEHGEELPFLKAGGVVVPGVVAVAQGNIDAAPRGGVVVPGVVTVAQGNINAPRGGRGGNIAPVGGRVPREESESEESEDSLESEESEDSPTRGNLNAPVVGPLVSPLVGGNRVPVVDPRTLIGGNVEEDNEDARRQPTIERPKGLPPLHGGVPTAHKQGVFTGPKTLPPLQGRNLNNVPSTDALPPIRVRRVPVRTSVPVYRVSHIVDTGRTKKAPTLPQQTSGVDGNVVPTFTSPRRPVELVPRRVAPRHEHLTIDRMPPRIPVDSSDVKLKFDAPTLTRPKSSPMQGQTPLSSLPVYETRGGVARRVRRAAPTLETTGQGGKVPVSRIAWAEPTPDA